ncbi:MAG: hypothetical protein KF855_15175 [Acidobacteria bacterium]|nr:hypothetical protein [Acidobacteriota bacterium]
MKVLSVFLTFLLWMLPQAANSVSAQDIGYGEPVRSQEISETDGLPVILHHLPEFETVRNSAVFINSQERLRSAVGDRPVLAGVSFEAGTEAATARYAAGQLLIIEYMTPQAASEADGQFLNLIAADPAAATVYKRIGNYSVFVFDGADQNAATALADSVKYQKSVQWLGEDPFLIQKFERYFAITAGDVVISTIIWISMVFGLAISLGILCGFLYFRFREKQRRRFTAFSDAGGLTRLNLDDLSEPIAPKPAL